MNLELFDSYFVKGVRPSQNRGEFKKFLEICEMQMQKYKIETPAVVELGIWKNRQKRFYEDLLGAKHICIDISKKRGVPDILGDTHNPKVIQILKKRLAGKPINILFIDAGHAYKDVKRDFEIYEPMTTDIVALHDIGCHRGDPREDMQVWRFWDDLQEMAKKGETKKWRDLLFVSLNQHRNARNKVQMGIGLIIKR